MNTNTEDKRAVSPVIGVILMVAITVILAAVIAAFVLDIGQQSEPPQANIDISEDEGDLDITVQNADRVDDIEVRGCEQDTFSLVDGSIYESLSSDFDVGSSATIANDDGPGDIDQFDDDPSDEGCAGEDLNFVATHNGQDQIITTFEYEG
ncbi:type IV pilin [Natronolimnobius sp. AArcel1]|uniref:type IV pilin n=1 Tax=Natronolimnobius sp. AArcel1 TaxID=1679093 RepID=UPI0013EC03EE|nr:type IV pilin N-terminal domain-containing protein [Natronolimnobius sp. AArcel1]NGM69422.1 type IV pilin [Natronolimnobius sp. AArcel1]